MKKTCFNCAYFHGCLSEEEPSQYHIHNYCEKFNMVLMKDLESEVNSFIDDHWNTLNKACPDYFCVSDDFETGEAQCWMFAETTDNSFWPDEKYEANKKHNRELAIKTLEYMFEKNEVWDEFDETTWYRLDDYYDDSEINYLKDLLERLKEENK